MRNVLTNQEVASRISIEGQTDTTVNVVDPTTNQTVQTLPAREVVYGIPALFGDTIFVTYSLIVLADNGTGGYSIRGATDGNIELDDEMPTFVRQAFDSFELLTSSPRPNVTSSLSSQEQSQQQLVQSAGGLTARLNANNFTTGDTITVNGTVAERGGYSYVTITVIDPRGEYVALDQPRVTADNIFAHSYVAGEQDEIMPEYQMVVSGNYLLQVQHGTDMVELTFAYEATGNMTGETPTAAAPSLIQEQQPQQQEGEQSQQQQSPQNAVDSVSIVPGSSTLTTDAFSPNPVQVSVGSTVTWTNDDTQPHTVTSGENVTPDGRFDSAIMAPAATFEHTFTEAGEFPYFCHCIQMKSGPSV
jgi:plastocyanin